MTSPPAPTATPGRSLFPLLCAAVFLEAVGVGMLFPLLARIQAAHHLPTAGLGIMSGANFVATLAIQFAGGRFLDGRRARLVLLTGLAIGAVSLLWFALSSTLLEFTVSRALGGVSYGIVMPAALQASTVGVPQERRGGRLGRVSSAQMAGIVLGPLAGTLLAAAGGLRTPFLTVAGATAAVFVVMALVASPAGDAPVHPAAPNGDASHRPPRVTSRPVVAVLLLAAASQLPNGLYDALWSRLLTDRGADSLLIGLSLTAFGVPFAVLAPLAGRIASRRSPLAWSAGAMVVGSLFVAAYGVVAAPLVIVALGVFDACAQAIVVPGGYAATAAVFPDRWAATGQSWFNGAGTAAAGAAAVIGAPVYAWAGPGAVFVGAAAISIALAVASVLVARPSSGRPDGVHTPFTGSGLPPLVPPGALASDPSQATEARDHVTSEDAREPG